MLAHNEEDKHHLLNMANAINELEGYIEGANIEEFRQDEQRKESAALQLNEIGGAAKLLSDDFKKHFPEVEWDSLIRLEDYYTNRYYEQDPQGLWNIMKSELPGLKDTVLEIEEKLENEELPDDSTFRGKPENPDKPGTPYTKNEN